MSKTKRTKGKKIRYAHPTFNITLNEEQQLAKQEILQNDIAIILGNAGSGKTLLACYVALELYKSGKVTKIVITRPTISKEDIGHLPGTAEEKLAPWMAPVFANMHQLLDKSVIDNMIIEGTLEVVPVTHMRGRTFTNAAIIFDEFQNAENGITEMILGRIGVDSKMFLCGDYHQIDLKPQIKKLSGVYMVEGMENVDGVCKIELKTNHRHPILDKIMKFFEEKNSQYK